MILHRTISKWEFNRLLAGHSVLPRYVEGYSTLARSGRVTCAVEPADSYYNLFCNSGDVEVVIDVPADNLHFGVGEYAIGWDGKPYSLNEVGIPNGYSPTNVIVWRWIDDCILEDKHTPTDSDWVTWC